MTELDMAYHEGDRCRWQADKATDQEQRSFHLAAFRRWKERIAALKAAGAPSPLADYLGAPKWSMGHG